MKLFQGTAILFLLCTILLSTTACSGNKGVNSQSAMNTDSVKKTDGNRDSLKKLTPVGPPTYAPGMVGVQGLISNVQRNDDFVSFELEVQNILGSGPAANKPAIGQKMSLQYSNGAKTSESAQLIQNAASLKVTLSYSPSITERNGKWSCEKVHLEN